VADDAVDGGGDGCLDGVLDAIGELTTLEVRLQAFDRVERRGLRVLLVGSSCVGARLWRGAFHISEGAKSRRWNASMLKARQVWPPEV
jgi:hypothetical protein